MIYQIKYNYRTGNSFGSEDEDGILEFEWENKDVAKTNLQRIKEHYEYYMLKNNGWWEFSKEIVSSKLKESEEKDWYVKEYDFCLKLLMDNGNEVQICAPWCGYFESLHGAEIVIKEEEGLSFTI